MGIDGIRQQHHALGKMFQINNSHTTTITRPRVYCAVTLRNPPYTGSRSHTNFEQVINAFDDASIVELGSDALHAYQHEEDRRTF